MKINNKFPIGALVYIISDPDQTVHQIVYIMITPLGLVYGLSRGGEIVDCYEIELSDTKNFV